MQRKYIVLMVSGLAMVGIGLAGCDRAKLDNEKAQYSYAIGHQLARNLKDQKVEIDVKAFNAAIKDVIEDSEIRMTEEEMMMAIQQISESRREQDKKAAVDNLAKGAAYLEKNKEKEGIEVTDSGLQYKVVKKGDGDRPKDTDLVEVHYRGRLIDGTEFDSSYERDEPARFPVGAVIPGWTEALKMMNEGSHYELTIPAELAYGERGSPPVIPPNSVLVFDVELLSILRQ